VNKPSLSGQSVPQVQSTLLKIILLPVGLLYRLWTKSIFLTYLEGRQELEELKEPVTIILWHNRLFYAGEWHSKFRKSRRCFGLISGSRDGAWLETFYRWSGIRSIRGSRNRRGSEAVRQLISTLKNGHDVGITPDGSRGPKYEIKPGALFVARASRSPILLLDFTFSCAFRLNSWDAFAIPLPFSKIKARTRIISCEDLFKGQGLDDSTAHVEQELLKMTDDS